MNKDRKKKRKVQGIKEKTYPKINIYNPRGRVIGSIKQGESIDYQKLLLKKVR
ncbi:hypothetical protein ES705_06256 [subsurface metagenome]